MKKIAVIGAGIFGCEIACLLSKNNYEVDLYESKEDILLEGTKNSQNRLHLGFHYPRDIETAIQSKLGYDKFKNEYPTTVIGGFKNIYGLSKNNSKVSKQDLNIFFNNTNLKIKNISSRDASVFGINTDLIDLFWETEELVIDIDILRNVIMDKIKTTGVYLNLLSEVEEVEKAGNSWVVKTSNQEKEYEYVIRSTYGLDSIRSSIEKIIDREYDYQKTFILEAQSDSVKFGYTVIDGDFITILPKGNTDNFLIYCPKISTVSSKISNVPPKEFWEFTDKEIESITDKIIARLNEYVPGFSIKNIVGYLSTIRSIQPNNEITDKRTSSIIEIDDHFFDVWSGKIDHCIDISEKILDRIKNE
jgi:flavin-dependent dehydrogenase